MDDVISDAIRDAIRLENAKLKTNVRIVGDEAPDVEMRCYLCGKECRGVRKVVTEGECYKFYIDCLEHEDKYQVWMSYECDTYVQYLREVEMFGFSFIDDSTVVFKYTAMLSIVQRLIKKLPDSEQGQWLEAINRIEPSSVLLDNVRKLEV